MHFRNRGDEEERDWENPDLPEGFDVYDYDPKRARRGQIVVLVVFGMAFVLFVLAWYLNWSRGPDPDRAPPWNREPAQRQQPEGNDQPRPVGQTDLAKGGAQEAKRPPSFPKALEG